MLRAGAGVSVRYLIAKTIALAILATTLARCGPSCRTCEVKTLGIGITCQQGCLDPEDFCVPNGVPLNEGAFCAGGNSYRAYCRGGACVPGPIPCSHTGACDFNPSQCHSGYCTNYGICSDAAPLPDGTACDGGVCRGGACAP